MLMNRPKHPLLHRHLLSLAFGVGSLLAASNAFALSYEESVSGDLSGNGAAPTSLDFSTGLNTVTGTMGSINGATDADIFTFTVAPGQEITSLDVVTYTPSISPGTGSFLAIAAGSSIATSSAATHLSNKLISGTGEILGTLATTKQFTTGFGSPSGPSGLTSPIGPGTYTLWFQEAGKASVDYTIGFTLVPEPSTIALVGLGLVAFTFRRNQPKR